MAFACCLYDPRFRGNHYDEAVANKKLGEARKMISGQSYMGDGPAKGYVSFGLCVGCCRRIGGSVGIHFPVRQVRNVQLLGRSPDRIFIHLLVHICQFIVICGHAPVIIINISTAIYSLIALHDLNLVHPLDGKMVAVWALVTQIVIVVNLLFALKIIQKFDIWLKKDA